MNKEGADQTGLIRRKVSTFVVRKQSQVFLSRGQTFLGTGALEQNVIIVFISGLYF